MSYDDFIAQNGSPKPTAPATKPRPPAPAPRISTAAITAGLAPGPQATHTADPSFIAALVAQLRDAFAASGPWPENLDATISFIIDADGKLRAISIVGSSNFPAFDAAAINACRQTRLKIAVPQSATGQPHLITFRAVPAR